MTDFLNQIYYGNSVKAWMIALGLIVLSVVIGRIIYWVFSRWLKFLTRKTTSQFDDILIDMIEEPIVAVIILFGMRYATNQLTFSDATETWVASIFGFALTLIITWGVVRLYEAYHLEYFVPLAKKTKSELDDQLLPILKSGVKFIAYSLGIVIGLNNAGFDVGAVLAGLGIGGLAFALAAQDTVSNIFGGITILIQRPFKTGDMILFNDRWMKVLEIGIRSSRLEDFLSQHFVTVPNSSFTNSAVTNITAHEGHWVYIHLKLAPETNSNSIEQLLVGMKEIFLNNDKLDPGFEGVEFWDYIDHAYEICSWYHVRNFEDRFSARTEVNLAVKKLLEKLDVKLALPLGDLRN